MEFIRNMMGHNTNFFCFSLKMVSGILHFGMHLFPVMNNFSVPEG